MPNRRPAVRHSLGATSRLRNAGGRRYCRETCPRRPRPRQRIARLHADDYSSRGGAGSPVSRKKNNRLPIEGSLARAAVLVLVVVSLLTTTATRALAPPPDGTPPIANAGPDQTVNEDTPVAFDGSGSTDNVGIVNYTWSLPAAVGPARPVVNLSIGGSAAAFGPVRPLLYLLRRPDASLVKLTTGPVDRGLPIGHRGAYPSTLTVVPPCGV